MKVLTVVGTRPEVIKLAPVVMELAARDGIESLVCTTAQHRQMADQMFEVFGITPDLDLDLMQPNQSLPTLASRMIESVAKLLEEHRPDWVLVQGDTTTAFVVGLAAFYCQVKIGHVEAGLRSGDLTSPWPEEGNRKLLSQISNLHFAPTSQAGDNLRSEGLAEDSIVVTGNTVIDALLATRSRLDGDAAFLEKVVSSLPRLDPDRRLVVVTVHRRENHGERLLQICRALRHLAARGDIEILIPLHPNPNVGGVVREALSGIPAIHLVEPLEYPAFVWAMNRSTLLISDSGGVQEEAPTLGRPVVVLRDTTERPEAVEAGCSILVGTDYDRIVAVASRLLDDPAEYARRAAPNTLFGDGLAARRLVDRLLA
jgi:UDP-N-acetylglucosamine 2-epimerase